MDASIINEGEVPLQLGPSWALKDLQGLALVDLDGGREGEPQLRKISAALEVQGSYNQAITVLVTQL